MPITWRNVAAPNFAASNALRQAAGRQIGGAFDDVAGVLTDTGERNNQARTQQAISRINALEDPNTLVQDRSRIVAGLNPSLVNLADVNQAGVQRRKDLLNFRNQNQQFDLGGEELIRQQTLNKYLPESEAARVAGVTAQTGLTQGELAYQGTAQNQETAESNASVLSNLASAGSSAAAATRSRQLTGQEKIVFDRGQNDLAKADTEEKVGDILNAAISNYANKAQTNETKTKNYLGDMIAEARATGANISAEMEQSVYDNITNKFAKSEGQITERNQVWDDQLLTTYEDSLTKNGVTDRSEFLKSLPKGISRDYAKKFLAEEDTARGITDIRAGITKAADDRRKLQSDMKIITAEGDNTIRVDAEKSKNKDRSAFYQPNSANIEALISQVKPDWIGSDVDRNEAISAITGAFSGILHQGEIFAAAKQAMDGAEFEVDDFNFYIQQLENEALAKGRKPKFGGGITLESLNFGGNASATDTNNPSTGGVSDLIRNYRAPAEFNQNRGRVRGSSGS